MSRARPEERAAVWMLRILSRTPPTVYLAVLFPVVVVMAATVLQPWLPPSDLLRDSQAVAAGQAGASPAYGLVSNVGIVVLTLSSGGAALGWLVLHEAPAPWRRLLLWAAVLTLVLVLDNLLLLHEAAAFAPGSGVLVAAAYGLAFLRFVVRFRDAIVRDLDAGLLLLAVGSLGFSLVADLLVAPTQASVLVEDGAKLLGLLAWSAFVLRTALLAFAHAGAAARAATDASAGTAAGARRTRPAAHR